MGFQSSPPTASKQNRLRVIIVGGSVAGLTLAHALYHSDIDFVVLEAHKDIAPQVGASIVVFPNGARILDQLGVFDDISALIEPLQKALTWTGEGKCMLNSNAPVLLAKRTGYPLAFLQRRDLLKVLSETFPDPSKIHTSKRVFKVDHTDSGVIVHCEDGSTYSGDVVVGADGIHSTVRSLMRQHIEISRPGATKKDSNSISAEFSCIFGLGNPVKGKTTVGECHRTYSKGHSSLSFVGRGGMLYWFLFTRLDRRYYGKEIPRFTKSQMEEAAIAFNDIHMTESVKFAEVWEQRTFANMCSVEESSNEHWTSGRFVCIGDSVHKMTPNLGAGGNAAIESAAALANSLSRIRGATPSLATVQTALREFHLKRRHRAKYVCLAANELSRIEVLATLPEKIMANHGVPLGDAMSDLTCELMIGAEMLENLPPPARSLKATMPWNSEMGIGKHENRLIRALYALPILLVLYWFASTIGVTTDVVVPALARASQLGQFPLSDGQVVSLRQRYFGLKGVDEFLSLYVASYTPALSGLDIASQMQTITLLGNMIPAFAIWMIESSRRGNFFSTTNILLTVFIALCQTRGIGFIAPIYYFLHYVISPLENYHAADSRLVQIGHIKTIILTIIISYIVPSIAMFTAPTLATRQWINGVLWIPFPIYAAVLQRILGKFVKDTTMIDRIHNTEADMPHLRRIYAFAGVSAAATRLFAFFKSPVVLTEVFIMANADPESEVPLVEAISGILRCNHISAFITGLIWVLLGFHDLKKAGKLTTSWWKIFGICVATTVVGGPGAAMAVMWAWREEVLAKREAVIEKEL
ncbi:hypothetical protein V494_03954 [Pseudogymnoascus sp. VKM F-4513 (FW-928)]|nr:hypothetical protein V494_03954 [Pseudogymnoascus sp. VKM F-4513 (FW-928)]